MKIVKSNTSISRYIDQCFFIVYNTRYHFGVLEKARAFNKVIKDEHPVEWIAKRKSYVLINWWEISRDLYNKYIRGT